MRLREKLGVVVTAAALVAGTMGGCGGGGDGAGSSSDDAGGSGLDGEPPPNDATLSEAASDAGAFDSATPDGDGATSPARVRFAWLVGGGTGSPAPLAFDVCIAPHGTGAFTGPLLATSSYPAGLQPFDVTTYFSVTPGRYDARVVAAGSATCAPIDAGIDDGGEAPSSDFTSLPSLAPGQAVTAVFVDPRDDTSVADLFTITDDVSTAAGKAEVRFVNVSENDLVTANDEDAGDDAGVTITGADLGTGSGVLFAPLFIDVTSQETVDPAATNGYRAIDPVTGVDMTVRPAGSRLQEGQLGTDALTLAAGELFTVFFASESAAGARPALIWCFDDEPSAKTTHLARCAYADATSDALASMTRFGNFLVDGAAADVCVKYHSYGAYVGPLGAIYGAVDGGASTPIPSQSMSAYYFLTGGLSLDVRFVGGGAPDCATSTADATFTPSVEPGGGGFTSLLLTGLDAVAADAGGVPLYDAGPPYDAGEDGGDAGPQPVSTGLTSLAKTIVQIEDEPSATRNAAAVRLVHVDAAHPQPLAVTVTYSPPDGGASSAWSLADVPYGGFSTRPGPIDPYGYARVVFGQVTIAIEDGDAGARYTMADDQTTLFAFDAADGGVQLLACNDFAEDWYLDGPLYRDCCVVGAQDCGGGSDVVLAPLGVRAPRPARRNPVHTRPPTSPYSN